MAAWLANNWLYLLAGVAVLALLLPAVGLAILSASAGRPDNLGPTGGELSPCPPSPNCVCSHDSGEKHRIEPIPFHGDADAALDKLAAIIDEQLGGEIATRDGHYLHAEFTSTVFRFVDDLEVLADSEQNVFHIRSASRVGRSDLGANRARVERLRQAWEARP